ncbi:hypothetical protein KXD40_006006 [Peronospora effusa]|uniref:Uncharacterized protein n=1 Tax=Peronospora effusa TaxID=542832 RepID=A0A3M6VWH8_9STRA|nr:hypothetical protein DD238_003703 [Peronospora effusa]RQM12799.1 hypothetical protein DD237_004172 [Peronospora effusa]UIZ25547.1 hypothetical protein KXD40_006006 [Peronospora effusa]CAI5721017.1 unnamed protein product [Peronospora effusa]
MTTVILSPPSGPANSPPTMPTNNTSVHMSVALDTTKETAVGDTDSSTSTLVDIEIEKEHDNDVEPEEQQYENVEGIANGVSNENVVAILEQRPMKKRRRVFFECADIVEFEPTVYTTSITSGGVPVGLSLNERSRSRRRLDSFEMERKDERVGRQRYMEEGYLEPQEREIILNNAGCEDPVIASVEAEVNAIIQLRRESNEVDFDFMYGVNEMEDDEEDGEEDEEVSTILSYAQVGAEDEVQEESDESQENKADKDAVTRDDLVCVDQEGKAALMETTVARCRDDEPEAASI